MFIKSISTSAFLLGATALNAQTLPFQGVVDVLDKQGYSEVEVARTPGRLIIEAYRGGKEREIIYDTNTGKVLSDYVEARDDDDDDDRKRKRRRSGDDRYDDDDHDDDDPDEDDDRDEDDGDDEDDDRD